MAQIEDKLVARVVSLEKQITQKASINHTHNNLDSKKLSPSNLLNFPFTVVVDASVAPTDNPTTQTIRFQIDNKSGTQHWYMWAFLQNAKTGLKAWHYVAFT